MAPDSCPSWLHLPDSRPSWLWRWLMQASPDSCESEVGVTFLWNASVSGEPPYFPGSPPTIPPAKLHKRLLRKFNNEISMKEMVKIQPRSSLMTGGAKRGVPNPWLFEEPEETRGLGFDEIREQQQKIIQEQDAGLDALSSIISRQKQMGQEIGNELNEQNEIIDGLANLVENTDEKLRTETRRVNLVDRKSTSCGMVAVTLLLLVAIVVVAVWPAD
nr:syntaxin-8 isoform X7 [Kogia breviceps]